MRKSNWLTGWYLSLVHLMGERRICKSSLSLQSPLWYYLYVNVKIR
jgi:hypothetical protein